ncbi:synaptotagmin-15-like [Panonychus citri]|uniref:synaptotagmin-15-like n=1 Tax=Panonychus citri TaxID=50023 RepID=UPI0023071192|nr:synaptotagmin-15-like [Panonychus citri]
MPLDGYHKFPIYDSEKMDDNQITDSFPTINPSNLTFVSKLGSSNLIYIGIASGCTLIVLIVCYIIKSVHNKRKKCYDTIDETTRTIISMPQARRESSKSFQGVCVYQNQPIDFILPGISTHLQPAPTPSRLTSPSHHCSETQLQCSHDQSLITDLSRAESLESLIITKSSGSEVVESGLSKFAGDNQLERSRSSLLGGLNPELYRIGGVDPDGEDDDFPDNHRGRIWFKVNYEEKNEQLTINLLKIKNLPSRVKGSVNCSDPFVRIYLLPDGRRYVQSKVKKKTCNPRFDETFVFQVPNKSVQDNSLRLTVFDNDRGKRHNLIGHVIVKLKDLDFISSNPPLLWRDLELEQDEPPSESGEINVSLCYNPMIERLTITVCEAKDLRWPDDTPLETCVKISLFTGSKMVKTKKTSMAKRNFQPNYNESFHFKLNQTSVAISHVLIQVNLAHVSTKGDKCLGRIVLGSHMFARGKALEHWIIATTTTPHKQVRQWHKLN